MTKRKWPSAFSVLFMAALLGGCGGGQVAGGGTGGTGMVAVRGQVESTTTTRTASGVKSLAGVADPGVSTITINGVTYDMSGADYQGEREIEPGMVVTLVADNATGVRTAQSAFYIGELKGPITEVAADGSWFKLLGHTVFLDERTKLSPVGLVLASNAWVEVSGFSMEDGRIHATYIAEAIAGEVEAAGYVTSEASGSGVVMLNSMLSVQDNDPDFDLETVAASEILKVTGVYEAPATIKATNIEILPNMGDLGMGDKEAEVEGLVSGAELPITNTSVFFVAGQPVRLTGDTEISGGMLVDIANGALVEVEGPLKRLDGGPYYIEAEEVEFEDSIEIEAAIETYDPEAGTITFLGDRVTIKLVEATQMDEGLVLGSQTCVDVRARALNQGDTTTFVASQVRSEGDCSEVEIQGPVEAIESTDEFRIIGLRIDARDITTLTEEDRAGTFTPTEFINRLRKDDLVSLKGRPGVAPSTWDEAEIER